MGPLIGVGGYGRVYQAEWRDTHVAVKLMSCEGPAHYQVSVRSHVRCVSSGFTCAMHSLGAGAHAPALHFPPLVVYKCAPFIP